MEEVFAGECQEQMQLLQTLLDDQVRGIEAISGNQVKGSVKLTKLSQELEQLILLQICRQTVLKITHSVPNVRSFGEK